MNNKEAAAEIRRALADARGGIFSWPTDCCGYAQHIRFVEHRNANWQGGDWKAFVTSYADELESTPDTDETQRGGGR